MLVPLIVSGFSDTIEVPDVEVASLHTPLLDLLRKVSQEQKRPLIVLLAAPPATGKSTLAALWKHLAEEIPDYPKLQGVSIDGFHYPNSYLEDHTTIRDGEEVLLRSIKGGPETYDIKSLLSHLEAFRTEGSVNWPFYDRNIHDPVPDAVPLEAQILIIEGNWVLLDEPGWRNVPPFADITIFLEADPSSLKERLINRKMRGGYSCGESEAHYERSDRLNIIRVLEKSIPADITIGVDDSGLRFIKKRDI